MKKLDIEDILETVFTTENPETGSQPPEKVAWVIFENETVCLITPKADISDVPTPEELSSFAKKQLYELGEVVGGTSSADFNVSRVPWFKDEYVYMITYDSNFIFNIEVYEEETDDMMVGMTGRGSRSLDVENKNIRARIIRDFNGNRFGEVQK